MPHCVEITTLKDAKLIYIVLVIVNKVPVLAYDYQAEVRPE